MIKALKVRLYPNEAQTVLLEKHFGSCRFVWNYFLEIRNRYHADHRNEEKKGLTAFDTMKMLTELKGEKSWLYEINAQSLQHSLVKLDMAFKSFFRHNTDYPNLRSRKDNQYFIVPSGFKAVENRLIIPKFMEGIAYRDKTAIPVEIKQVVITKDVNRYYASIQYESDETPEKGSGTAGIDLGIKSFATLSDGLQVEPPNSYRNMEKKLKRQQKKLSRKKKGSANRRKQVKRVQKIHQQIRDARTDYNHRVSTAIAKHYGTVVVENLNISGMQQNRHLAKSITDQGWSQFKGMLEYKMEWRNAELIEIGRFDPSSKLCSRCGNTKHDLELSVRTYHCDACNLSIDRDLNAAINIRNIGLMKAGKGIPEFTPVESATAAELSKGGLRVATL